MDEDRLRRILADGARAVDEDRVSERVAAAMASMRRLRRFLKLAASLAIIVVAGAALAGGYGQAAQVLPPIAAGGGAVILWLPAIVVAGLTLSAAYLALVALNQSD
ncbi:MAG TPA: hypothetical protein VEA80_14570 [Vitreimonas sp.]|uniref:hypothetical protein n=1 Tax=Vitreimonas sp. TaxID=3069702 RepID=UPI002D31491F|nr:hypothetical protein [Vitreimonas sp.]HYD88695.1 hypothetical protein [Vitreimonas sp.]